MNKIEKKYGSWTSKLTASVLAKGGRRYGHLTVEANAVYWLESIPEESGRVVIYSVENDGSDHYSTAKIITPANFSVRTRVHEYGGADFSVRGHQIVFSNDSDQRLYLQEEGNAPRAITPESPFKHAYRYADIVFSKTENWIICVRERHSETGEPLDVINEIVKISLDDDSEAKVLVSGSDFYSYPRISPNGNRLAWTSWEHPKMPWDETVLWTATLDKSGSLSDIRSVVNNQNESVYQPVWCPDGELHFVSDRSGWWNIYSYRDNVLNALTPINAEFGFPQWEFGKSSYAFSNKQSLFAIYGQDGREHLCLVEPEKGHITPLEMPYCTYQGGLYYENNTLFFIAATETESPAVIAWDLSTRQATKLSNAKTSVLEKEDISVAEALTFKTTGGRNSHAFYYGPTNAKYQSTDDEKPPLIVMSHGGPTSASTAEFNAGIQFWTNRGFAVVDVNYGGSTGFGRDYRDKLLGQWGIVDVDDCVNAAKYLVERGRVDEKRLAIRGGSAGGYTTYKALTEYDIFSAGMSRYGVADLTCLVKESHKFEVRYLDSMIGPWPEEETRYISRSPINHADKFNCPVLLLQGDEDAVVPPAQSIAMAEALDKKKIPHALIMLKGEQHGFRKSENICLAIEAELNFYGQIFKIDLADRLPELRLKHSNNLN